jgi:hypothetical protein
MIGTIAALLLVGTPIGGDGPIMPPIVEKPRSTTYNVGNLPPVFKTPTPDKYQVPSLEIMGVEEAYDVGDLIHLSIKPLDELPAEMRSAVFSWTVLPTPEKLITWPDNSQILFGTGPTNVEYTIILTATFAFGEEDVLEHRTFTNINKVVVGGAIPQVSNRPAGEENLDKLQVFNRNLIKGLELVTKDGYSDIEKAEDIKKLAASYRKLASIVESQKNLSSDTIFTLQLESDREALGSNSIAFLPWYKVLSTQLSIYTDKKSISRMEYAQIYRIIATALENYQGTTALND